MSYQSSFLQAFAGYYFVRSKFLTTLKQSRLLKSLQVYLQVQFYRQPKIMLLADIDKYLSDTCYKLRHLYQMLLYWAAIVYVTLAYKWLSANINGLQNTNNQYFWRLRKFLTQTLSACGGSYIFDIYIVKWLCKNLLQIELSRNKKVFDLQSNFDRQVYQSSEFIQINN
ncbi:MAG: hypothetical protein AAF630_06470 [Cyanobacteria bacterium P01_C01_bin.38]